MNIELYNILKERLKYASDVDELLEHIFDKYKHHHMYFIFNKNTIIFTIGSSQIYIIFKKYNKNIGQVELGVFLRYLVKNKELEIQKYLFDNII